MTTYEQINYEVADGIATITLNRPERLNAFTAVMRAELVDAFDAVDADDDVRVAVVTGAGRAFCAGADLGGGADTFNAGSEHRRAAHEDLGEVDGAPRDGGGTVSLRIAASRKPVIAAINGASVGVGATMTLPMDIRLASESARFGFVFARRGIVAEAASTWFLPRVVGISQAMEWAATGRVFGAEEALRGRLVSRVVPDGELLATAREIASRCASAGTTPASSRSGRSAPAACEPSRSGGQSGSRRSAAARALLIAPSTVPMAVVTSAPSNNRNSCADSVSGSGALVSATSSVR
ncbi:enoyl-CoA hydratase-related protein [Saccharopolyspora erythraea]|uniref:enoyl-CoA hydratase-related protein n=1 Tax=Saccharopolyspora erythraea TaxID=1836 RepID=UPI0009DBA5AE|nr:enoyl-CoA hydratase-related protein [Saccharopolyspora erythraea]